MNNNQLQVVLTGIVGDGCLFCRPSSNNYTYHTSSISKNYLNYKKELLGDLCPSNVRLATNSKSSYPNAKPLYSMVSIQDEGINGVAVDTLENNLNKLDDLGLALWVYDDGSLHKNKLFYNINTQKYNLEQHKQIFEPYFLSKGIVAKTTVENKKNGKSYYYLRISRYEGADKISAILSKYYCSDFNYKIWSSETIQKWSKFQEKLKSKDNLSNFQKAKILARL